MNNKKKLNKMLEPGYQLRKRKVHVHKKGHRVECGLKLNGGLQTDTFISGNVTCRRCLENIGYPLR